jgi:hypothetical protein
MYKCTCIVIANKKFEVSVTGIHNLNMILFLLSSYIYQMSV